MELLEFYHEYTKDTEPPKFYQEWCFLSTIGALLGRNYKFSHGHFDVFPNMYTFLIGSPGTRKSTAINLSKNLLVQTGYSTFSANRTSKEKFISDMDNKSDEIESYGNMTRVKNANPTFDNLFKNVQGVTNEEPKEMYIVADEVTDFIGRNNEEFISLLTSLWDCLPFYESRIKTGRSIRLNQPTVSLLAGSTPAGFATTFPANIIGQGFFSRILLIYGESSGRKITFPKKPSASNTAALVAALENIQLKQKGIALCTPSAFDALDEIYKTWVLLRDLRFNNYSTRRFTHLLKLCLIVSAVRVSTEIELSDVIYANSLLSYTEVLMPKALAEFGNARNSEVASKVMAAFYDTKKALTAADLWKSVSNDLDKITDLAQILMNLTEAGKIVRADKGFLPSSAIKVENSKYVDYTMIERIMYG